MLKFEKIFYNLSKEQKYDLIRFILSEYCLVHTGKKYEFVRPEELLANDVECIHRLDCFCCCDNMFQDLIKEDV